ncbi:hypothetical protein B0J13DRAFT_80666 [Dactylonectria estremocensis]|uniref:Uncharacterized protein n=1 Tax=Dactylonectria estremocensis TaxID=1079267 RepID=A0A9P9EGN6_9HYPO|nr:hypothetical protein B0J13DRAFT_80666 [Dactylonectria estremocensis]
MGRSINPLRRLTSLTIEYDQVPSEIRSCLELVRTCNKDLQRLIELRNEHLSLLEKQPETLDRVNSVIEAAHAGLAEACEVVERCRPGAHGGKTPFRNRMKWILGDSLQFRNHEPVISRHHSAVLAELIFVRQMTLWSPIPEQQTAIERHSAEKAPMMFENITLLEDFMGDAPVSTSPSTPAPQKSPPAVEASPSTSLNLSQTTLPSSPSSSGQHDLRASLPKPASHAPNLALNRSTSTFPNLPYDDEKEVVQGNKPEALGGQRVVLNSTDNAGLSLLLGDTIEVTSSPSPMTHTESTASVSQISLDYIPLGRQVSAISRPISTQSVRDISASTPVRASQHSRRSESGTTDARFWLHAPNVTPQSSFASLISQQQLQLQRQSLSIHPAATQRQNHPPLARQDPPTLQRPSSTVSSSVSLSSMPSELQPQSLRSPQSVSNTTTLKSGSGNTALLSQMSAAGTKAESGKTQRLSTIPPELIYVPQSVSNPRFNSH